MSFRSRIGLLAGFNARIATRAALTCFVGAALIAAMAPARAGDANPEENVPLDTKIVRSFMESLGLVRDGGATINYEERAPLVIPPTSTLPPPEADGVAKNPNWPIDPDVKRAKEARAAAADEGYNSSERMREEARPLRPSQLNVGRRVSSSRDAVPGEDPDHPKMTPGQLGYKGGLFSNVFGKDDNQQAKFTREPGRAALTDPPAGYQTPSPNQPYGTGGANAKPAATNYYVDHPTERSGQ